MAVGWARDGAVNDQIDASIGDEVKRVREMMPTGPGLTHCALCEEEIPEARRKAIPGVTLCVACQQEEEQRRTRASAINRRGSKDSQLR